MFKAKGHADWTNVARTKCAFVRGASSFATALHIRERYAKYPNNLFCSEPVHPDMIVLQIPAPVRIILSNDGLYQKHL